MPADACGFAIAPGSAIGTPNPCQECPLLRDDGRGSVGILVAGEHNLVVAPSPRPSDLDREAAVHGVAFRGGGVEQDRTGGITWGNVEGGMVVRLNLFTPSAPYRNCQRKQ